MSDTPNATALIKLHILISKQEKDIKARHTEELKPVRERKMLIENLLHKFMKDAGSRSLKATEGKGVSFLERAMTCSVLDKYEFLDFIETELPLDDYDPWELIDIRANKPAVRAYIDRREREEKTHPTGEPILPECLKVTFTDVVRVHNK